jgi:hypothetical protein
MEAHEEFTATTLARLRQAADAAYCSDPEPYLAMWSRREPVSLFGALGPCKAGWPQIEGTLRWVTSRFSDPDMTTDFEVVHVGSDLAYTVGYEHGHVAIDPPIRGAGAAGAGGGAGGGRGPRAGSPPEELVSGAGAVVGSRHPPSREREPP